MKVVFATAAEDPLGGVFAFGYRDAKGPVPVALFVHLPRKDLTYSGSAKIWTAWKLFGLKGSLRLASARYAGIALTERDRVYGLHHKFLSELGGPGTQHYTCRSLNDETSLARLSAIKPDILVSIGAPVIFKSGVLRIPKIGSLNIHNARLPAYRGHFGTFWEVMNDETYGCVSVHKMVEKVDAGECIAVGTIAIREMPSMLDLMIEKKFLGGRLLGKVLRHAQEVGRLPDALPAESASRGHSCYYGWPTLGDIQAFSEKNPFKCT